MIAEISAVVGILKALNDGIATVKSLGITCQVCRDCLLASLTAR